MLSVIKGYGEHLPAACQGSCEEAWAVFDSFLVKYGNNFEIADRVTRVLRHGISLFGPATRSVAATALKRLSIAFDHTGYSGYMWIAGKLIANFGVDKDQELHSAITNLYTASTLKVVSILQVKDAGHVPDGETSTTSWDGVAEVNIVLEDYLHLLKQMLENTPDIYFEATTSTHALRIATVALNVIQTEVAWTALEHIRNILVHPCLGPTPTPPPSFPIFAAIINQGISAEGKQIVQNLVSGLAEEPPLPDDSTSMVITVFRSFAALWPRQLLEWLPAALELLPSAPAQARKQFFDEVNRFMLLRLESLYGI
jgi:transportin-3